MTNESAREAARKKDGKFGEQAHAEPDLKLGGTKPAPAADRERYVAAAALVQEACPDGAVSGMFGEYDPDKGTDGMILQVDGRNMIVWHAGTDHPKVAYGDDEADAWSFTYERPENDDKTATEILAETIGGARHDAACQEAWRGSPDTFQFRGDTSVEDFGVRFVDGDRVIALDINRDGVWFELTQKDDGDVRVFVHDEELPDTQLDALASDFDEDHAEGTGPARFKEMMQAAADRASSDPGYSPRITGRE